MSELADRIHEGDPRATSRGISIVEDDPAEGAALVRALYPHGRGALIVGVTGAAGVGKSTIVDGLIGRWRAAGRRVGVLAVDPSSPFTGGAMLGDRVRMQAHSRDSGVFIRSMATRGSTGGLARATFDASVVLDAAGFDPIIVETVGVGQDEIDIVSVADVIIVVLVPGLGDEVQSLKAGVMEIADVFVVNKADRPGADRVVGDIETLIGLVDGSAGEWSPRVIATDASTGRGLDRVVDAVSEFGGRHEMLARRRRRRTRARIEALLQQTLAARVRADVPQLVVDDLVEAIIARRSDPYAAARALEQHLR